MLGHPIGSGIIPKTQTKHAAILGSHIHQGRRPTERLINFSYGSHWQKKKGGGKVPQVGRQHAPFGHEPQRVRRHRQHTLYAHIVWPAQITLDIMSNYVLSW